MRREAGRSRHEIDNLVRAIHRLERADTKAHLRRVPFDCLEQVQKRRPVGQIAAVRAQMHAGDGDLPIAGIPDAVDLRQHIVQRPAAARPTRGRNDAVRARLIAAGLHAQRERRAPCQTRRDFRAARAITAAEPLRRRQADFMRKPIFPIVRNYLNDTRKGSDFLRTPGRIAAGHDDSGAGIFARDLADNLTCALIGGARDRAGIHDNQIGVLRARRGAAGADQLLL